MADAATRSSPRLALHDNKRLSILAFGDSLTEGYTDFGTNFHPYGHKLYEILTSKLPGTTIHVDIQGRSGDKVLHALRGSFSYRLERALERTKTPFDLVILLGGTNDLAFRVKAGNAGSDEIFDDGLKPLYEHILSMTQASLLVVTVPERAIDKRTSALAQTAREAREHLNHRIKTWASELENLGTTLQRVFCLDLAPLIPFPEETEMDDETPQDESIWSPDGLHMSSSGYDHFGKLLAEFVLDLLGDRTQ